MMKRLILATVLLALSIGAAVGSSMFTGSRVGQMRDEVEYMREQGSEAGLQQAEKLERKWRDSLDLLALYTDHTHIDEVSGSVANIKAHIKHADDPLHQAMLQVEYDRLVFLLDDLVRMEKFDIDNVL